MIRILNVLAVLLLLGSAVYAYSIKYETILASEKLVKIKHEISRERDAIDVTKAEWAHLVRPARLQEMADKALDLQALNLSQFVRAADLPDRAPKVDAIGRKLEALGLAEPTNTPGERKTASVVTPSAPTPKWAPTPKPR